MTQYDHSVCDVEQLSTLRGGHNDSLACLCLITHDFIDFCLGADINAAGRFVHQKDSRIRQQTLGNNNLLLIAAGKCFHPDICIGSLDFKLIHIDIHTFLFSGRPDGSVAADLFQGRKCDILPDAHKAYKAVGTAVLCDHGDSVVQGICS